MAASLTRNQTAILIVLARDEQRRVTDDALWVGRTLGSLVNDVSCVMGASSAYAGVASLERAGFVVGSYKRGPATGNLVLRMISITESGMAALEEERILIEELVQPPAPLAEEGHLLLEGEVSSTADDGSATMVAAAAD